MKQWKKYSHKLVLDEMLRLKGWGAHTGMPCGECFTPYSLYECTNCFRLELFCKLCILMIHWRMPFHTIEVSNSVIFTLTGAEIFYLFSVGMNLSLTMFLWNPLASTFTSAIIQGLSASTRRGHQTMTLLLLTTVEYTRWPSVIVVAREPSQQKSSSFKARSIQSHWWTPNLQLHFA